MIGIDIIGMGDFAVTNGDSKTTLSFRIPSSRQIDFAPDARQENVMETGNRHERRRFAAIRKTGGDIALSSLKLVLY